MKLNLGIAWRLGLALAGVGVLAAALTGYYGYSASRAMLIAGAEERLQTATRVLVRQLAVGLNGTARDVRMLADHPQAARLLARADPRVQEFNEDNVALLFERVLDTHPEYFQMRLIDVTDHGLERIRVDRDDNGLVRVSGDDLQEKGHYPYVFETLRLPAGKVYVSRPAINHEVGAHAGLGKPSLQVAAPVHDANGLARGVVVINVDLNGLFAQLAADLPRGLQLYLTNSAGDFLIHPDPAQAFAFDRGQVARLQDAFPAAAAMTREGPDRKDELVTTATPVGQDAVVAAFMRQPLGELQREDEFILGLAQPLSVVLKDSEQLGAVSVR
ncbi:MAG TPA: cache domain-containing protein, partial [Burkholderiaceae bacterium]|nr:cache domain-containing protein [Burkholderiaceae bacterium]